MDQAAAYKRLLYEHEVLWARYEIRDHHLKKIGERIYDDIGQVLSLVRIQLCHAPHEPEGRDATSQPGNLVGKAIRDLRDMHRSFYPETELLQTGLVKTLEHELQLSGPGVAHPKIKVTGPAADLPEGTQLIVFRMLQELMAALPAQPDGSGVRLNVLYEDARIRFAIEYNGDRPNWNRTDETPTNTATARLSLPERAQLVGGTLAAKRPATGRTRILLTIPFKTSLYGS